MMRHPVFLNGNFLRKVTKQLPMALKGTQILLLYRAIKEATKRKLLQLLLLLHYTKDYIDTMDTTARRILSFGVREREPFNASSSSKIIQYMRTLWPNSELTII